MHGFLFVSVATVWALVALVHSPRKGWWVLPFLLLLMAALYVNLGRALWFWTGLALLLSVFAAGWRRGWAIALVLFTVTVFGGAGLAVFKPKVIDNIVERADSVRGEGGARTSYGWRKLENEDALPHIMRRPLTGLGLGAEYRRWMHEVARFEEHTRYVHNSYVFISLKTGVLSLLGLLTLLLLAWRRGWHGTRAPAASRGCGGQPIPPARHFDHAAGTGHSHVGAAVCHADRLDGQLRAGSPVARRRRETRLAPAHNGRGAANSCQCLVDSFSF
jgi:O-antigen ligase